MTQVKVKHINNVESPVKKQKLGIIIIDGVHRVDNKWMLEQIQLEEERSKLLELLNVRIFHPL